MDIRATKFACDEVYYIPDRGNFPAIGSAMKPDKAFQMTVLCNHPVQYCTLKKLKDRLQRSKLKLYFVVPPEVSKTEVLYDKKDGASNS